MEQEGTPKSVDIRELTEHMCKLVVKSPDKVDIKETGSGRTKIVTAQVADDDIGRVIGKQGSTIRAIRTLLDQVGRRQNQKVYFEIKNKLPDMKNPAIKNPVASEDNAGNSTSSTPTEPDQE